MMQSASFSYQVLGKLTLAVSIRPQNAACLRFQKKKIDDIFQLLCKTGRSVV